MFLRVLVRLAEVRNVAVQGQAFGKRGVPLYAYFGNYARVGNLYAVYQHIARIRIILHGRLQVHQAEIRAQGFVQQVGISIELDTAAAFHPLLVAGRATLRFIAGKIGIVAVGQRCFPSFCISGCLTSPVTRTFDLECVQSGNKVAPVFAHADFKLTANARFRHGGVTVIISFDVGRLQVFHIVAVNHQIGLRHPCGHQHRAEAFGIAAFV